MEKQFFSHIPPDSAGKSARNPGTKLAQRDIPALLAQSLPIQARLERQCARNAFDILGAKAVTYARAALDFMNAGNTIAQKIVSGRLAVFEGGHPLRSAIERRQLGKTADMARSAAISFRLAGHELGWLREEIDQQASRLDDVVDGSDAIAAWMELIDSAQQQLSLCSAALQGLPSELATLPWRYASRAERNRTQR